MYYTTRRKMTKNECLRYHFDKLYKDLKNLVWIEEWKYKTKGMNSELLGERLCHRCMKFEILIPHHLRKHVKDGNHYDLSWINCGCCGMIYCPGCFVIQDEYHYW